MRVLTREDLGNSDDFLRQLTYNGFDTCVTYEVFEALQLKIAEEPLCSTYAFQLKSLEPVLTMMRRGFRIDMDRLETMKEKELIPNLLKIEGFIKELASVLGWEALNINSHMQLKRLFYEDLDIPPIYDYKGNKGLTTGRKALEKIKRDYVKGYPFANAIMLHRDIKKLVESLSTDLKEGRWHASFNVAGTTTGRWSSSDDPFDIGSNLQNIKDKVRRIFVADEGHVLYSCDQQGAEARYVAYKSGDENYIRAVESGDVHTTVASLTWGFAPDRKLADRNFYRDLSYREVAKRLTHASNYFGTPRGISAATGVEVNMVEEFQKKYFRTFPGISRWHDWVRRELMDKSSLTTALGFRRFFWDRSWSDDTLKEAIAFEPQSIVGRLTAWGMCRIHDELEPLCQNLSNGHDAAIGQMPEKRVEELLPRVLHCLDNKFDVTDIQGKTRVLSIPWEPSLGKNWGKRKADNKEGLTEWKVTI